MKLVLNRCFGGFSLSDEAKEWLIKNRGWKVGEYVDGNCPDGIHLMKSDWGGYDINETAVIGENGWVSSDDIRFRSHKDILDVVEALGEKADGRCARLEIVEVPDGMDGEIEEYDGSESFEESHQSF